MQGVVVVVMVVVMVVVVMVMMMMRRRTTNVGWYFPLLRISMVRMIYKVFSPILVMPPCNTETNMPIPWYQ